MYHILILENIRSAYNTGVMLRTCDGLWRKAVLSGFTPRPEEDEKVAKTALGAEKEVVIGSFWSTREALDWVRGQWYVLVAAEKTPDAQDVRDARFSDKPVALVMGNENTWVLQETLGLVDHIVHIPMQGMKESLNVAEAAAILMREMKRE
jgi:23S rRNA (guanosine2251-2'-O)-methyltransferase